MLQWPARGRTREASPSRGASGWVDTAPRAAGPAVTRRGFLAATGAGAAVLLAGCAGGETESTDPAPEASVVTRWDTDPWALGSYSALPDRDVVARHGRPWPTP